MVNQMTKEEVYRLLCEAKGNDTLGFFVGAGFSKALLGKKACSWKELLRKSACSLDLDEGIVDKGNPFPQVASEICKKYEETQSCTFEEAQRQLKSTIASTVNVPLDRNTQEKWKGYLSEVSPSWVVTTNYDLILERLYGEKALSINALDGYIKIKDTIPIYHIHGSIVDFSQIVISNEDYTSTLRLSDYRRARLPFLFKESTVLLIGYSLNDLNVLSALDYSQYIYSNSAPNYKNQIIQLVHKPKSKIKEPYISKDGIIVFEIGDIETFFANLVSYYLKYRGTIGKKKKRIYLLNSKFMLLDEQLVNYFIVDTKKRLKIICEISELEMEFRYIYPNYVLFLRHVFNNLWNNAHMENAFAEYAVILKVLLDIIYNINYDDVPMLFKDYVMQEFEKIASHIGPYRGQSYKAYDLWQEERNNIPQEFINWFNESDQYSFTKSKNLLDKIK